MSGYNPIVMYGGSPFEPFTPGEPSTIVPNVPRIPDYVPLPIVPSTGPIGIGVFVPYSARELETMNETTRLRVQVSRLEAEVARLKATVAAALGLDGAK